MKKSTVVARCFGNYRLRPGVFAHAVARIDLDTSDKNVVLGVQFIGRQKKSEVITFETEIPSGGLCIDLQQVYALLRDKTQKTPKKVERFAAQQIAEEGTLRIYGEQSPDTDIEVTVEFTFRSYDLQIQVPLSELLDFVK